LPCEYLVDPNSILEDVDPSSDVDNEQAVLDTLFDATAPLILTSSHKAPTMTYYHGSQAHQFVFSGFGPWSYARSDCLGLVDFILQDLWGLHRDPIDRGPIAPAIRNGAAPPKRIVTPAQRAVGTRAPAGAARE